MRHLWYLQLEESNRSLQLLHHNSFFPFHYDELLQLFLGIFYS